MNYYIATFLRIETHLNVVVGMTIIVCRSDKFILVVGPFTINNILVLVTSFLLKQIVNAVEESI